MVVLSLLKGILECSLLLQVWSSVTTQKKQSWGPPAATTTQSEENDMKTNPQFCRRKGSSSTQTPRRSTRTCAQ
eukprot:3363366-Amphidinium_carterae.1